MQEFAFQSCYVMSSRFTSRGTVFAGLRGQVVDVSFAITTNLLILQALGTSLQNNCAQPGSHPFLLLALPYTAVTICKSHWCL